MADESSVDREYPEEQKITFNFRFTKYYFDNKQNCFIPIVFDVEKTFEEIHQQYAQGVSLPYEYEEKVSKFGKCDIILPNKNTIAILFKEVLNPFYIFQFFSLITWYLTEYEIYASCILFTSIVSITVELIDIKRNLRKLRKMAQYR